MSWPQNHLPKYRKHRATGQAVVTLSGKDHYLGPHGTKASKLEYDRLIAEWLQNGRPTLEASSSDLTVVEVCAKYFRFAKGYYRKHGRSTGELPNIRLALRFLRQLYGHTPADQFGPVALQVLRNKMIEADHSRGFINSQIGRIKRMFKWAVAEELIPASVHQALTAVPGLRAGRSAARESEPVLPVSDEVIEDTLPHMPEVVADMVRLQRLTGMRPAELCQVRPCDIDRSSDVWIFTPEHHKTEHHGRPRMVFIGPQAQQILLRYLARDSQEHCFQPRDSEAKRRAVRHAARVTPLNCGNKPDSNRKRQPKKLPGSYYTTNSYRRAIHYACDKAFPHPELGKTIRRDMSAIQIATLRKWQSQHRWSPNQLRHTAATEVRKQFGLEAAQIILGHSAADVTQVYAERDLAKGLEVARRIG